MIAISLWREEVELGCQKGLTPDEAANEADRRLNKELEVSENRGEHEPNALREADRATEQRARGEREPWGTRVECSQD